jgi:PDZ domain-containing protein
VAAAAAVFALTYHPPVAVVSAGRPIDITADITITGVPVHPPTGRYVITWVRIERPTLFGLAQRAVLGDVRMQWDSGVDAVASRASLWAFEESRRVAAAAAARAAGMPVEGVLPFQIQFRQRALGGSSAGLVYALAITDMLGSSDLARGRIIAATGTLRRDGSVGEISGLQWKIEGAMEAQAALFLVPEAQAGGGAALDGRTQGVRSLDDALDLLRAHTFSVR